MKKQIVSTHDQRLAHHVFLDICISVVWPVSTANHLLQHVCKILRYIHTLEVHVEWLAEADIRNCLQIGHVDFVYSAHLIPSAILMELCIQGI